MKRLCLVVGLVGVGLVGLGFYQGWFHVGSDSANGKSNLTLAVDTDKFQADKDTAVANVQEAGRQIKDKVAGPSAESMDGTVVSVSGDKLTMTNKAGKEHSHALAANIKVTCDGKPCTAADLKAGMKIRVTTDSADRNVAAQIEAIDKDLAFAGTNHDGKVVSVAGNKLVMTNMEGEAEHTCTLTADTKITCDGKLCEASDLKPGMRIRVTSETAERHSATAIEALDKNLDFEKGV